MYFLGCIVFLGLAYTNWAEQTPEIIPIPGGMTGKGITTRYWDCSKPSCAWIENLPSGVVNPAHSCDIDGSTIVSPHTQSSCDPKADPPVAFMCTDQQPWIVNSTLSYGFAAASFEGGVDESRCCTCMLLSFQGQLAGKQHLIQITNTGSDLSQNQFDLSLPGGGVGLCTVSCARMFGCEPTGWGEQYGGISSLEECDDLPKVLQPGCRWRWEFMEGVPNPEVTFQEVQCPKEIVNVSGCY
ncbi:unnamed protein product [Ceutorhynchus assimilis]|uniref:Cellulase n=1 Tax=Ceutorhynchus assimilis TaxID=467358 RepID=A0A9N9QSR0_9CUCU|nr:unnamed protein product [Ceutorhynchus assimilis]